MFPRYKFGRNKMDIDSCMFKFWPDLGSKSKLTPKSLYILGKDNSVLSMYWRSVECFPGEYNM
jgi:hypothetical protein